MSDQSVEDVGNSTGIKGWYFNGIDTSSNVSINRVIVEPGIKDVFNVQLKEGRWLNKDNSDKKNFGLLIIQHKLSRHRSEIFSFRQTVKCKWHNH